MVSKAAAVLLAAAGVAGVAAVVITQTKAVTPPPVQGISNITLTATPLSGNTPLSVTFAGVATNSSGAGVGNTKLYLFVNNILQSVSITTAADGTFSFVMLFAAAGNYACDVADNTGGV